MLGIVAPVVGSGGATAESWIAYDGSNDGAASDVSSVNPNLMTRCCVLSASIGAIVTADAANSSRPTSMLFDISGTTASHLNTTVLKSATASSVCVSEIDSRYFLTAFYSSGAKARVVDTDGSTQALVGSEQDLNSTVAGGQDGMMDLCKMSGSTDLAIAYIAAADSDLDCGILQANTGTGAVTAGTAATPVPSVTVSNEVRVRSYAADKIIAACGDSYTSLLVGYATRSTTTITAQDVQSMGVGNLYPTALEVSTDLDSLSVFGVENTASAGTGGAQTTFTNGTGGSSIGSSPAYQSLPNGIDRAIFMDSDATHDYWLGLGEWPDKSVSRRYMLQGLAWNRTTKLFDQMSVPVDTGVVKSSNRAHTVYADMKKISATKAMVALRNNTTDRMVCYIANL